MGLPSSLRVGGFQESVVDLSVVGGFVAPTEPVKALPLVAGLLARLPEPPQAASRKTQIDAASTPFARRGKPTPRIIIVTLLHISIRRDTDPLVPLPSRAIPASCQVPAQVV